MEGEDRQTLLNADPISEFKFVPICVEINNSFFLLIGICQMYCGIEIRHPVYGILFGNLIIALASSLLNIFVFPYLSDFTYSTLVNGNNVTYFVFYLSCWLILSVLRYAYVIKPHWLHEKFPEPRTLLLLSYIGVLSVFTFFYATVLGTLMGFGWPSIKLFNMRTKHKIICTSVILGNLTVLLGISCIFYIVILRKRGKLGQNQIAPLQVATTDGISAMQANKSQQIEISAILGVTDQMPDQFQMIAESKELERQRTEINTSMRSLETNMVLAVLILLTFFVAAAFSNNTSLIILTILKGFTPILTTVANFGKIQQLTLDYCNRIKETVILFCWS